VTSCTDQAAGLVILTSAEGAMDPADPKKRNWEQRIRKLKDMRDLLEQMSDAVRAARPTRVDGSAPAPRAFVAAIRSARTVILQPAPGVPRQRAITDAAGIAFRLSGCAVAFQLGAEAVVIHPEAPGVH
jgi:hypothetical protein